MRGWGWSGTGMGWEVTESHCGGVKEIPGISLTEGPALALGFGQADGWAGGGGITQAGKKPSTILWLEISIAHLLPRSLLSARGLCSLFLLFKSVISRAGKSQQPLAPMVHCFFCWRKAHISASPPAKSSALGTHPIQALPAASIPASQEKG